MDIKLWENEIPYFTEGADTPNYMTFYSAPTHHPAPCVVVFPGGGYSHRADHEGGPVAEFFTTHGIHAAVVQYRTAPNRHPSPLADAQRAIRIIRANAKKWFVDPERIVTLGFSAGGHLAASTVTLPPVPITHPDEIDALSCAPNGAVLCYPVIDVEGVFGHVGSGKNLLGDEYEAHAGELSLQNRVSDKTPQVFLWHTSDDGVVNVKNTIIFGEKLREQGIPFEMHIYPHGKHGLGLALGTTDVSGWAGFAADWINKNI